VAFVDQPVYCDVTWEDEARLSPGFVRKNVVHPDLVSWAAYIMRGESPEDGAIRTQWRTMRTGKLRGVDVNVCAALRGSVMSRVSCSVYDNRPEVCRKAVQPGDRGCRKVRAMITQFIDKGGH
jgi:hypothetical protein